MSASEIATAPKRPSGLRAILIAATIIGVVLVNVSLVPLMFSPMLFGGGESAAAWGWFVAVWLFPVVIVAGVAGAWIAYAKRRYGVAWAGLVLATLPVLFAAGIFVMAG